MSSVAELRTILARPSFRRLYATRLVSQTSDGVLQVGLAAYVFFSPEQQPTPGKIAAAFAVLLLPYSLVGPFAGVLLDRWRRRQVLVYANIARSALVLALVALVLGGMDGSLFFGTALGALSVNRFYLAALSAALPHVVPYERLVVANSLSTTSGTVVAFAGGGIGYGLRWLLGIGRPGTAGILAAAAVAYLGSSLVAATMERSLLGPDTARRPLAREQLREVARGLRDGARHVWSRRRPAAGLATIAAHRFCYGASVIMTLLLFRNHFHAEQVQAGLRGLALVFAATGAGFLAAALITPPATARMRKELWITLLLLGAGVAEAAFGAPFRQSLLVVAGFVLGVASQGVKISVDTIVQESVDDGYRGWVFSCYDMLYNVAFVSAAAFAAVTLPASGKSYTVLGVIAAGYTVTGISYWLVTRKGRPHAGTPQPAPAASTASSRR